MLSVLSGVVLNNCDFCDRSGTGWKLLRKNGANPIVRICQRCVKDLEAGTY